MKVCTWSENKAIDGKGEKKKFIMFLIKDMEMINFKNFCSCILF